MSEQAPLPVENAQKIGQLATAVEKLIEVKRTSKALEAKKVQKREETRTGIEKLEDEIEEVAKQSGIDIEIGESAEKSLMEKLSPAQRRKMEFFTSKEQRGSRYASGWGGDR